MEDRNAAMTLKYHQPAESILDPSKPLTHFHAFLSLPVDLLVHIINLSHPSDAIILSLTSKSLYTFIRPLLLRQNPKAYSLRLPTCSHHIKGFRRCDVLGIHSRCASRTCSDGFETIHCGACRRVPLHKRLLSIDSFIPKHLKWCGDYGCSKFLPKRRLHKGRCLHRQPKPRAKKKALGFTFKKRVTGKGSGTGGMEWVGTTKIWSAQHREWKLESCVYSRGRVRPDEEKTGYALRRRPREAEKVRDHWRDHDEREMDEDGLWLKEE